MRTSRHSRNKIFAELKSLRLTPPKETPEMQEIRPANGEGVEKSVEKFMENMTLAQADVRTTARSGLAETLIEILAEKRPQRIALAPDAGLDAAIEKRLAKENSVEVEKYGSSYEAFADRLFEADLSISKAECGIAKTGSLAVFSSPSNPRSISLVPPVHVCLLDRDRIYPDLETMFRERNLSESVPNNLILISGPSRTADIEFNISLGIHGPKHLVVLLVAD